MYILYIIFRKLSSFLLLLDGRPGRLCSVVVRLKGVYSAIELQAHTGLSGESRPHGLVVQESLRLSLEPPQFYTH